MKLRLNPIPKTRPQWRAHNAARRKRETWMPKMQEAMFRKYRAGRFLTA